MMKFVIKFRIPIIAVFMIITALIIIGFALNIFGIDLLKLESNAGFESMMPEDNADYKYFKEMEDIFGNMDTITIGISSKKSIYNNESINVINEISTFLEDREEIEDDEVLSLTTVDNMYAEYDELIIEPLIENEYIEYLETNDFANIKNQINENPLFNDRLVSKDDKSTIIIANVTTAITLDEKLYTPLIDSIYEKVKELRNKYKNIDIYVSGFAVAKSNITKKMQKDLRILFLIALIVVFIILYITLREIRGTLIPLSVTILSIIWTFGLKGLLKIPITVTEIVIPVMLIAIGCADGVHIISEFYHFIKKGLPTKDALKKTMKILTTPVILTSITTSLGFFSLITAPGVSIKNMGLFLAFGVMTAMFLSLFFIPAVLSFYRNKKYQNSNNDKQFKTKKKLINFDSIFNKWSLLVPKYKILIILSAVVFILISIIGIINVRTESDPVLYFKKNDKFRIATNHLNKEMGGISDLYIVFENNETNYMKNPDVLKKMWDLQKYTESLEQVSFTFSLVDYIRQINFLLNENDESFRRIPKEKETIISEKYEYINNEEIIISEEKEVDGKTQVANLLLLYEMGGGEALESVVNEDYTKACIHVRLNDTSSYELEKTVTLIDNYIKTNISTNIDTGYTKDNILISMKKSFKNSFNNLIGLFIKNNNKKITSISNNELRIRYSNHYLRMVTTKIITRSQIISLIITIITIAIVLSIIFRSPIIGIITVIPTVIAVLLNFAIMWISKTYLDIGTSIIAAIGIGVGVDYAIHYFQRFKLSYFKHNDYLLAVKESIKDSIRAIMSNALSVGLGFAVLMFSSFKLVFNLGWIVSISMFTTAFSALIILPALILIVKPKVKRINSLSILKNKIINKKNKLAVENNT